jgi:hypothetical protein
LENHSHLQAFDAFGLSITAPEQQIITFARDHLSAIYVPDWLRPKVKYLHGSAAMFQMAAYACASTVAADVQLGFRSPTTVQAFLCRHAAALSKYLPECHERQLQLLSMKYRTKALHTLRKEVEATSIARSRPSMLMILQAELLFGVECAEHMHAAAQVHAKVIPLIETTDEDPEVILRVLRSAMFSDTELACKTMRRTLLDYDKWLPDMFNAFWAAGEALLPALQEHLVKYIHPALSRANNIVFQATVRVRRCVNVHESVVVGSALLQSSDYSTRYMLYNGMGSRIIHDVGLLINTAVDMIETVCDGQANAVALEHCVNTALVLATLYSVRKLMLPATLNGTDLRDAPAILAALERQLDEIYELATAVSRYLYREEIYWTLFIRAWHGQQKHQGQKASSGNAWDKFDACNEIWYLRLAEYAEILQLKTWSDAQQLLSRFVPLQFMRPAPATWYEHVVSAYSFDAVEHLKLEPDLAINCETMLCA